MIKELALVLVLGYLAYSILVKQKTATGGQKTATGGQMPIDLSAPGLGAAKADLANRLSITTEQIKVLAAFRHPMSVTPQGQGWFFALTRDGDSLRYEYVAYPDGTHLTFTAAVPVGNPYGM